MATLTATDYKAKWNDLFADNTIQDIDEARLRSFAADTADSFGGGQVNVPRYVAGTVYPKDYLILQALVPGGPEYLFRARKLGMLPAPTSQYGDSTSWKPALPTVPDNATSQSGTWAAVWQAWNDQELSAGRQYIITGRDDGLDVYLEALDRSNFKADVAYTIDNGSQAAPQVRVDYDLPTDSWVVHQGGDTVGQELATHEQDTGNPHQVSAAQVGLGNVSNTSDANKPVSTATQAALDRKAELSSPSFTNFPTAPTAAPGSNNTLLATTAFVIAQATAIGNALIANLVGAAPATLDTVYELAAQVGSNTTSLSSLFTILAGKLNIASNLADLASASAARANLGLGNVNNTSDSQKPVSSAQAAALGLRFLNRGAWAANTTYAVNDVVLQANVVYYATAAFTSGSSFSAANWQQFGSAGGGGVTAADLATAKTTLAYVTKTTNYTVTSANFGSVIQVDSPADITVTIPLGLGTGQGEFFTLRQIGIGRIIVAFAANVTPQAYPTGASKTPGQYTTIQLHTTAPDVWNMAGAV